MQDPDKCGDLAHKRMMMRTPERSGVAFHVGSEAIDQHCRLLPRTGVDVSKVSRGLQGTLRGRRSLRLGTRRVQLQPIANIVTWTKTLGRCPSSLAPA